MTWLEEVVERGDLDECVRTVDRFADAGDWDGVLELRDRCRWALARGRQLWPVASLAEYRVALQAPGPLAASVLVEGAGRFALGPLPEVAASTHAWAELGPHVTAGPAAVVALHERVVRGEDLRAAALPGPDVLELPTALQTWEPTYAVATYHPDRVELPAPDGPEPEPTTVRSTWVADVDDGATVDALRAVVRPWLEGSDGRARVVVGHGDAAGAATAASLDGGRTLRLVEVHHGDALAEVAWAGASGGAHGRRPGAAAGRFAAWWLLACLGAAVDDWPVPPDELGAVARELRWYRFDAGAPATGWHLGLAVEDSDEGVAWAVHAVDQA